MTEREERAKAIAAMIATDIESAAERLEPGETLQLQISYDNEEPIDKLSYTILIVAKHRKLEDIA